MQQFFQCLPRNCERSTTTVHTHGSKCTDLSSNQLPSQNVDLGIPQNVDKVLAAAKGIVCSECSFTVISDEHAAFTSASKIKGGIISDLKNLRIDKVSRDSKTTDVGNGNRWSDYGKLNVHDLSVVGGRVGDIGVSELSL